jgi:hypothetical protein
LEQAVRLAPNVADHHWRLGEEQRRAGLELEAREEVREALELDPSHVEAKQTMKALQGLELRLFLRWLKRLFA